MQETIIVFDFCTSLYKMQVDGFWNTYGAYVLEL